MGDTFNRTNASNYLKTKYGAAGIILYNSKYVTSGTMTKEYDLKGDYFEEPLQLSLAAGVGSGDQIPEASVEKVERVQFDSKNMYSAARISNKLMQTAVGGESAFIDARKHKWEQTQTAFAWNVERALWNELDNGSVGTVDSVVNTDPTFAIVVTAATWKEFNFQIGMWVNFGTGTELFRVTALAPATRTVTVVRSAGSQVPAATNKIYMQNSKDKDILSMPSLLLLTTGTAYGVAIQYGWQAHQQLNVGVTVDEELIDNAVLDIEAQCGEGIDYIETSRKQWKVLKSANVGLKRYTVQNSQVPAKYAAQLGFTALEYHSPVGSKVVPIMYNRFCADGYMVLRNKSKCKLKHVQKPQWFDEDGTVFMRTPDRKDDLEARWYAYMELYMYLTYNGIITGLS